MFDKFSDHFKNEAEFLDFKSFSPFFVSSVENMNKSLVNQGYSKDLAKQVTYEKLYPEFLMARSSYQKMKGQS